MRKGTLYKFSIWGPDLFKVLQRLHQTIGYFVQKLIMLGNVSWPKMTYLIILCKKINVEKCVLSKENDTDLSSPLMTCLS